MKKISPKKILILLIALFFLAIIFFIFISRSKEIKTIPTPAITPSISSKYPAPGPRIEAKVTRVIDGDTIVISDSGEVRLIGIDTPELKKCFYQEAKDTTTALVLNQNVQLESDINDKDNYGRLLRYVYVEGEMVNEFLVTWGFAKAENYFPEKRYYERFVNA